MRTALITLISLTTTAAVLAPAAPAAAESAIVTIGQLEAEGFHVNVDRVGSAPLDQCVVTSVRNPQEETRFIRVDNGHGRDVVVPIVVRRTITVSLDCSK